MMRVSSGVPSPMRVGVLLGALAFAFAIQASPASADGAALYKADCSSCHGMDGKADTPVGKAMKAKVLAGNPHTLEQVTTAIRTDPKHKSVTGKVSDDDLKEITEFLKTL